MRRKIPIFMLLLFLLNGIAISFVNAQQMEVNYSQEALSSRLNRIMKSNKINIAFDSRQIANIKVPPLKGKFESVEQLLSNSLSTTSLGYRKISDRSYAIINRVQPGKSKEIPSKRMIEGVILDSNGESVIGANVTEKGTVNGSFTDMEGKFSLSVNENATLVVSYVGYQTYEQKIGSHSYLEVRLKETDNSLNEVIVVGYGTAKRKDVTGSVQRIRLDNTPLADVPNANPLLALSSTVSGITINPQSLAGQDPLTSMSIRGENSIDKSSTGLNKPLLVVDGVIFSGSINEINMQDVASIDVLKDASAAAIYGSRSANGVIIITTKRGKTDKPVITLNASYAIQNWSRKPEMQDDMDIFLKNRWDFKVDNGTIPADAEFNPSMILNPTELSAYEKGIYTNWLDEITQYAPVQNYNLSISGDAPQINYYLSAGYLDQKGVIMNDRYKKITLMGKIDTEINRFIKAGVKVNYYTADNSGLRPKMQEATWMTPLSFTTNQTEGYEGWLPSHPGGTATSPIIGTTVRPGPAYTTNELKNRNIDGAGWIQIKAPWIKGLDYKITLNGTWNADTDNQMIDPRFWVDTRISSQMDNYNELYLSRSTGYAQVANKETWLLDQILSYSNRFEKHYVDAMVGYTRDTYRYNLLKGTGTGFNMPITLLWDGLDMANTQKVQKSQIRSQNVGMMGRINYNYGEKYYLTGSVRRDGFSGFAPGNKFGSFLGLSAGYAISQEKFMETVRWVDYLKIRLSYGETGNQGIKPYETLSKVATSYNVYGETSQLDIYPTSMSNTKLSWSITAIENLGVDFNLLGNRLSGSIDVYRSKTRDQLLTRSIPILTGYATVLTNVGRVDNKGVEILLNGIPKEGDGVESLRWESGIVFALNRNKLVELYGTYDKAGNPINDIGSSPSGDAYIVGKSIHSVWDLKMLGVVQTDDTEYIDKYGAKPGDVKFLDYNNDGKINANDRHYQGDRDPLFTMNINNTLSYKNFSLYFSFKWTAGNDQHYLGRNPYGVMVSTSISSNAQLKNIHPWTTENPTNEYPRVAWTNGNSYQFWRNREFLKLKDLSLSYTLGERCLSNLNLQSMRIYFSANNLFTLSGWNGLDPEDGGIIAAQPGSNYNWSFPVLRTFSLGTVISF